MDFKDALRVASENAGWSVTKIAAEAGVSEGQARKWLAGTAEPRMAQFRALRAKLPGFANMVDRGVTVA
jgi:transcriptional regulator with XRE-family HTH domain